MEKLDYKEYKKQVFENRFFLDDYLKMMKFYRRKFKKNPYYLKTDLEKDYCKSGLSNYDTFSKDTQSINYSRYKEDEFI